MKSAAFSHTSSDRNASGLSPRSSTMDSLHSVGARDPLQPVCAMTSSEEPCIEAVADSEAEVYLMVVKINTN
jgi:hypothetical protein